MSTIPADAESGRTGLNPSLLGKGLAAFRIFAGLVLLLNGLAKLFSFTTISLGPYEGTLIDREGARSILELEVNERGGGTDLPLLPSIVNDFILPNFGWLQWVLTAVELGAGTLLVIGLATRGAALLGLGQQLFIAAVYFSSARFLFEQPHEYVPLAILAVVPAGLVWGLDGRFSKRWARGREGRWPF